MSQQSRIVLFLIFAALVIATRCCNLDSYLSLAYIKSNHILFQNIYHENQVTVSLVFALVYVAFSSISIPGASFLSVFAGSIFGVFWGTIIVSFSSAIGSTVAFFLARYFFRTFVERRYPRQTRMINEGVKRDGAFYLFTLRLLPLLPYFVINIFMGITKISPKTFYFVSQLGMLPSTIIYTNAGSHLRSLEAIKDIFSFNSLLSLALLGLFPLASKRFIGYLKSRRVYRDFCRPRAYDYNVLVIGAGSAGLVSAYIASAVKAKVGLVEANRMGGDCLNTSCVPSKALLRSAKFIYEANRYREFGIKSTQVIFEFEEIMERVNRVISSIEPQDSKERYSRLGVDCFSGKGSVISPWETTIGEKKVTSKNIILATGASVRIPRIDGLETIDYLTSETVWRIRSLPKSMTILGGGPVGCEFAQCFARFGSKVTLVESSESLLPLEDTQTSHFIQSRLENEGIKVLTRHQVVRVIKDTTSSESIVLQLVGPSQQKCSTQILFVATGRVANTIGYGFDDLGLNLKSDGSLEVNDFLQTKFANIYGCGDVVGPFNFTHIASHQAWYCTINALFGTFKKFRVDYSVVPWCTFTDPEVATVGLLNLKKGCKSHTE